jgi:hypothetical protein
MIKQRNGNEITRNGNEITCRGGARDGNAENGDNTDGTEQGTVDYTGSMQRRGADRSDIGHPTEKGYHSSACPAEYV